MGGKYWFILIVIVMVALAYIHWQKSRVQLKALSQSGFSVTDNLKGQPLLLVDLPAKQVALVSPEGYQRLNFAQVKAVELKFDVGPQMPENYRLHLDLVQDGSVEVYYENEWLAQKQLAQLTRMLGF